MKKRVGSTIQQLLPEQRPAPARVTFDDGSVFDLGAPLADLLRLTLSSEPQSEHDREVTTSTAAAFLNVSRTTVTKMIDSGRLPARLVGTHRRVLLSHVLAARETEIARRTAALDELLANSEHHRLYDTTNKHPLR